MSDPEGHLIDLISQYKERKNKKWEAGRFRGIKALSTTEKGDVAEDFAVWLGKHYGFAAEKHESKRGQWDVKISNITLEVKVATEDIHGCFQFNGIRYDTKYDRLLVIGISPDRVLFNAYPRRDLMDMPLARMARGTNATYKLTRRPNDLLELNHFQGYFSGKSSM